MAKSKSSRAANSAAKPNTEDRVIYGSGDMHDAFQTQINVLLENADITEEERQRILMGMSCPCCGGSGISMTIKLGP